MALEADVGHLDARARVGAAVDVDRQRGGRTSGAASSSSADREFAALPLVSTIASLQNSMPVQAIVPRRNSLGRHERARARARPATSGVDLVGLERRAPRTSAATVSADPAGASGPRQDRRCLCSTVPLTRDRPSGAETDVRTGRPAAGRPRRGRADPLPTARPQGRRAAGDFEVRVALDDLAHLVRRPSPSHEELQPRAGGADGGSRSRGRFRDDGLPHVRRPHRAAPTRRGAGRASGWSTGRRRRTRRSRGRARGGRRR